MKRQNPEIEIQNLRSEKLKQRNKRIEDMKNNKSWNAIHLSPWFTGLLLGSQRSCQVAHGRSFVWPDGSLPRDLKVIHMESTDLHLQSCRDPDSDFIHLLNVDESSSVIFVPWGLAREAFHSYQVFPCRASQGMPQIKERKKDHESIVACGSS